MRDMLALASGVSAYPRCGGAAEGGAMMNFENLMPVQIGDALIALGDSQFTDAWFRLPIETQNALPDPVRRTCIERYRKLTPYIDDSVRRAERSAPKVDVNLANPALPPIVALEIGELLQREFPAKDPLLSPWLRRQDLVMVHAWRGVGKTHFAMNVA